MNSKLRIALRSWAKETYSDFKWWSTGIDSCVSLFWSLKKKLGHFDLFYFWLLFLPANLWCQNYPWCTPEKPSKINLVIIVQSRAIELISPQKSTEEEWMYFWGTLIWALVQKISWQTSCTASQIDIFQSPTHFHFFLQCAAPNLWKWIENMTLTQDSRLERASSKPAGWTPGMTHVKNTSCCFGKV